MSIQCELFLQEGTPKFKIPTNLENVSDIYFQSGNALSLAGLQVTKNLLCHMEKITENQLGMEFPGAIKKILYLYLHHGKDQDTERGDHRH
jgi:hypothetical protein